MTKEKYTRWHPVDDVPNDMDCRTIDDDKGLRILMSAPNAEGLVLQILFDSPICYRNINESYRLRTWSRFAGADMRGLFQVENSEWLSWIRAESSGTLDDRELVHYAIFSNEDCIEIISEFSPEVSWVRA